MDKIRLSEKEVKMLVFIEDKVDDPIKLSHQLDIEGKKFNSLLQKLEKNGLVLIKRKANKPFSVKPTKAAIEYLKKNSDKIDYC